MTPLGTSFVTCFWLSCEKLVADSRNLQALEVSNHSRGPNCASFWLRVRFARVLRYDDVPSGRVGPCIVVSLEIERRYCLVLQSVQSPWQRFQKVSRASCLLSVFELSFPLRADLSGYLAQYVQRLQEPLAHERHMRKRICCAEMSCWRMATILIGRLFLGATGRRYTPQA